MSPLSYRVKTIRGWDVAAKESGNNFICSLWKHFGKETISLPCVVPPLPELSLEKLVSSYCLVFEAKE